MQKTYKYKEYPYMQSVEQKENKVVRYPVVVVGAGPVGLTAGLDLAKRGIPAVILDDNNMVSLGSRAVCYAKRSLEIWDRLGCAKEMLDKGISWHEGKVFYQDDLAYEFDLLPEQNHKMPGMINLQQYYLEEYLVEKSIKESVDLRWKHKVVGLERHDDYVSVQVETPDGVFTLEAEWVIACDGASSQVREWLGADFTGKFFMDRFLIADVVMKANFPTQRWFWFDAPFHPEQSTLLHRQSDDVWRIDFQLGWDADPEEERKPENVKPRIKAMLGDEVEFDLEWVSVYQFSCRRMKQFRHGRVLFAGDAAHQVSPFGARGANSGMQDIDNLVWKLGLVLDNKAPQALLDSYHDERSFAADDNIRQSTRSTDFMTPKNGTSRFFRDAVLSMAKQYEFARPFVNSGRLSMPSPYVESSSITADNDNFSTVIAPGHNCPDAPIGKQGESAWLLSELGECFTLLVFEEDVATIDELAGLPIKMLRVGKDIMDTKGILSERYDAQLGTTYLIRPDQYIAARWRDFDVQKIEQAMHTALHK